MEERINGRLRKTDIICNYMINNNINDCEHRYFHLNAIRQNDVRLRISKKYLFPPYYGEHTKILE